MIQAKLEIAVDFPGKSEFCEHGVFIIEVLMKPLRVRTKQARIIYFDSLLN